MCGQFASVQVFDKTAAVSDRIELYENIFELFCSEHYETENDVTIFENNNNRHNF